MSTTQNPTSFSELFAAIEDGILVFEIIDDHEVGGFVEVNEAACNKLGYTREHLMSMNVMDLDANANSRTQTSLFSHLLSTLVKGHSGVFESQYICKNQTTLPVEIRSKVISYQGGSVILSVFHDITNRKQKEAAIHLTDTVIKNVNEGIMVCDADTNVIYVNPAFSTITGYQADEIMGKTPNFLQSGRHKPDFYSSMWSAINTQGSWQGEVWNRRANGVIFPEWLSISSIKDDNNNVVNYIAIFNDISLLKESEDELRFLAHHDPLTKLPNRILLNDRLEHALTKTVRNEHKVVAVYLDLDHFKHINDGFGHPFGDAVLKVVAKRLLAAVKDSDTVTRVSGDEFVIILEDMENAEDISMAAQRILDGFTKPIQVNDNEVTLTGSMGLAIAPDDGNDSVQLLQNADTALYRAKEMGRNTFEFYSKDMNSSSFETLFMLNSLHKAIDKDEFILHYQPQVNTQISQFTGVEALIRWNHSEMGMISPIKFITLAEESGIIVKIGEWVLREACRQMKTWLQTDLGIDYIAVNISARQLMDKNFVSLVEQVLQENELPGHHIELELTESVVMEESHYAELLIKLKRLGVRISIDDFGTGYSSMARLKQLPIDKLKIDMSFIRGIPQNEEDTTITKSIISLTQGMKLQVVAEGVEQQSQAIYLMNNGCTHAQGYFYCKPMAAKGLEALIERQKRIALT